MTRAAYEPHTYPPDHDAEPQPHTRRRTGLVGRLGPVGIAAIVACVLMTFGLGAVAWSVVHSTQAPAQGQVTTDQPTAVEPPGNPLIPTADASASDYPSPSGSAKPSSSAALAGDAGQEAAAVSLINAARTNARCRQPLRVDDRLRTAARAHSADMASHNFLNHTGTDRSSATDRMRGAGYPDPLSEDLAKGSRSANEVVGAWLRSPPHRRNLLDCNARAIGIGVAVVAGQAYWTADLGRS